MDGNHNLFLRTKRREIKLIEAQPLDIQPSDLYSSYAYDYPMVELQETLFRYSTDLEKASNSQKELVVLPLNRGAKKYCELSRKEKKDLYSTMIINKNKPYKFLRDCALQSHNCIIEPYLTYQWFKKGVNPSGASDRMKLLNKTNNPSKNPIIHEKNTKIAILKRIDKYKDLIINEDAHQIFLGSLLGDGCLTIHKWSPRFTESHCMKQKEYLNWKINFFKKDNIPLTTRIVTLRKNGKQIDYPLWNMETKHIPQLLYYHSLFYGNGKKEVNWQILQQLEPLGLAVWYMDDGTNYSRRGHNEISIATQCFTKEQLKLVQEWFKFRWNINITIRPSNNTIYIKQDSVKKFIELVKPHITNCMKYKIGYRGD